MISVCFSVFVLIEMQSNASDQLFKRSLLLLGVSLTVREVFVVRRREVDRDGGQWGRGWESGGVSVLWRQIQSLH